jgi:ribosomal protein S18 acetylase RimI-like enzyme
LKFEPFKSDTTLVKSFDCESKELNDFLCTDEVENFENELLGKTTLVFCNGALVGYYTLYSTMLRLDYLKSYKSFSKLGELHSDGVPSLAIGRLAVDKEWKDQGIGSYIILKIAMDALYDPNRPGARLLLVQAKEKAFPFYIKLGFQFVSDTKSELKRYKAKGTRTMFLDLAALKKDIDG